VTAQILYGKPVASKIQQELAPEISGFRKQYGVAPTLAVVRVGNPPAAVSYARSIDVTFTESEMGFQMHVLPEETTDDQLIARLNELTRADDVHGILLQRPLPHSVNVRNIMVAFPVLKDVEGVTPNNVGNLALDTGNYFAPSTPSAALQILSYYSIPIEGKKAVVVGRSAILGKPMALLLLNENATVAVCHTHTRDLPAVTRQAELLIAAAGRPGLITADMVAPGATVIDFGVNTVGNRLVGDADFERVKQVAGAITPVPGGTGPVSTMMLMRNTLGAAQRQMRQMGSRGRIKWLPILRPPKTRR
jgi:methylenetetrahydrofolate dehydrogenase (NADP+)/methenyltetrahydrofolate cyclohydrolase